jgi:hypothetical protein
MKHYSLRWKLVTWAALFAFTASVICLSTTWILVRAQELQALDRRLTTDARELFRDIENFQGTNKRRDVTERFVPLALRDRLVEVRGPEGDILYMSPKLKRTHLERWNRNVSHSLYRRKSRSDRSISRSGTDSARRRGIEGDRTTRLGNFSQSRDCNTNRSAPDRSRQFVARIGSAHTNRKYSARG